MPLYTRDELLEATGGQAAGALPDGVTAVTIDSRDVPAGALFVAIRGERFDGHDFVAAALEAGAGAALVRRDFAAAHPDLPLIGVDDPLAALRDLAAAARARFQGKVVAITGSAGKTTTKEMVRQMLAVFGPTHFSIKSFNNHWGVPLMLAGLPRGAAFGVFEIGMNHAGEITPLVGLVRPHVGMITTVAEAHIAHFGTLDAIAEAKAEILTGILPGGVAVLNVNHAARPVLDQAAGGRLDLRIVRYGRGPDVDWWLVAAEAEGEGTSIVARHEGKELRFSIAAPGSHMAQNGLGALIVADALGLDLNVAMTALGKVGAAGGRGASERLGPKDRSLILIDESYNANPASMRAALSVFAAKSAAPGRRRVLVLGDMFELGEAAPGLHQGLAPDIATARPDALYLVGEQMSALPDSAFPGVEVTRGPNRDAIADRLLESLAFGDLVMIKGSNGLGLSRLVTAVRERFGGATAT